MMALTDALIALQTWLDVHALDVLHDLTRVFVALVLLT